MGAKRRRLPRKAGDLTGLGLTHSTVNRYIIDYVAPHLVGMY